MVVLRAIVLVGAILSLAVPVVASDDTPPTPLQEAVAYLRPQRDISSVEFIDWAQLKDLHDGEGITSASPLQDRQRLMLGIVRSEALPPNLGLDLLATWPEAWGWDRTDLDWEARLREGRVVLRFAEHWDPEPFRAALARYGYEATHTPAGEIWQPAEDAQMPTRLRLGKLIGTEYSMPDVSEPTTPLAIAPDERTVVLHFHDPGARLKALKRASRPNLDRVSGTPAWRAATALGQPLAGSVVSGADLCSRWPEFELVNSPADVVDSVLTLHAYQARAQGYGRADADADVEGRFAYSFAHPRQAREDARTRSLLVQQPHPWNPSGVAGAADFVLVDSQVEAADLILDVQPVTGRAVPSFGSYSSSVQYFNLCGPTTEPS